MRVVNKGEGLGAEDSVIAGGFTVTALFEEPNYISQTGWIFQLSRFTRFGPRLGVLHASIHCPWTAA